MKCVITTVGTSAIEKAGINTDTFKDKPYEYFDTFREDLAKKKREIYENLSKYNLKVSEHLKKLPAEIKSLAKLRVDENTKNYLLVSDTAECRLCSEFLKDYMKEKFSSEADIKRIKGLQVKALQIFQKEGLYNLVDTLLDIINFYQSSVPVLNITGGYKATIPYLTIIAQIKKVPIYYIFEEEENLISIPNVPIIINKEIFNKYNDIFIELERRKDVQWNEIKDKIGYEDNYFIKSIIYTEENLCDFTPLGKLLWEEYKNSYIIFWITAESKIKIDDNPVIQRILKDNFAKRNTSDIELLEEGYKIFKYTGHGEHTCRILYKEKDKIYIISIAYGAKASKKEEYRREFEAAKEKDKKHSITYEKYLIKIS
ncbi:MAG: putative CRISPR-associated protein [bacterium]|nr:putative CRISPR-associated protein [bacterium]